jgi:hypothetical protein
MEFAIDLSDASKALDLNNIRFQLMCALPLPSLSYFHTANFFPSAASKTP